MNSQEQTPAIEFIDVWKTFPGAEFPTLAGVSLVVPKGCIQVVVGFSGTGKSVTLKHLLGLLSPDKGTIKVFGETLIPSDAVKMRDIRKKYGMLFQGSALFDSLDVFENIAFPMREHRPEMTEDQIEARVRELLREVNLEHAIHRMPSQLSGGMQKRVGLARAIALDPEILLFDEPTTGLDPVTSKVIDDLIVATTRRLKATAFIISHDIHAALRIADNIGMIWKGEMVEVGRPQEFRKSQHPEVKSFLTSAGVI